MNVSLRILLVSTNHITGNLVNLKLKSYGHEVTSSDNLEISDAPGTLSEHDLVVLDNPESTSCFESCSLNKIPVIVIGSKKKLNLDFEGVLLELTFNEEEFLHKYSFVKEGNKKKTGSQNLLDSVISHYSGDRELTGKVLKTFLSGWENALLDIEESFREDDDKILARKIHSFKGVLSALGETKAANLIKKMEILVKGRSRQAAMAILPELKDTCRKYFDELSESALS